jgi:hypothetical protein
MEAHSRWIGTLSLGPVSLSQVSTKSSASVKKKPQICFCMVRRITDDQVSTDA